MIHSINLNGQDHAVLFGNWAFKKMKDEKGLTFSAITDAMTSGDVTILPTVLFYAIQAGRAYHKQPSVDFTEDDLALWMDAEGGATNKALDWLLDSIKDMSGTTAENENTKDVAKKKK
jgi:hypothetical protein